ncbi:MAG TPA: dihydroorotate dehydrogenase [Firmicutes bacterium]|nr:dihydroorotate dehydrogenase [Bacillota bacterium]
MPSLKVKLGLLELESPLLTASGTFGFGEEYAPLMAMEGLGALITKTITLEPRLGNPSPRMVETPAGMLNAIGLQNPGLENFIKIELPRLHSWTVPLIVSIAGETEEEYVTLARALEGQSGIAALELNLSCPNVKKGGILFGMDAALLESLVGMVRAAWSGPLIAKLTPNVTAIEELARAAARGGAQIISAINTLRGMVIDITARRPLLGNLAGGLSGPAIRPVAVKMVYDIYAATSMPVIGVGGIMNTDDALQFVLAGAAAVAVGTANFVEPRTIPRIAAGLREYLAENGLHSLQELVGAAHNSGQRTEDS